MCTGLTWPYRQTLLIKDKIFAGLKIKLLFIEFCSSSTLHIQISCTRHLKTPHPPIRALAGDCGDFHLIHTSFWFPGRRGIRSKSRSSHHLPGYLLAAQRSVCLFHGCQQSFLTSVLRLAIISCFTKGEPCVEKQGRGNAPLTFVPGNQGTHFHLHKK